MAVHVSSTPGPESAHTRHRIPIAMNSRNLLLCLAALPLLLLSSCASGEYKLESTQDQEKPPYESWNYLPKNS